MAVEPACPSADAAAVVSTGRCVRAGDDRAAVCLTREAKGRPAVDRRTGAVTAAAAEERRAAEQDGAAATKAGAAERAAMFRITRKEKCPDGSGSRGGVVGEVAVRWTSDTDNMVWRAGSWVGEAHFTRGRLPQDLSFIVISDLYLPAGRSNGFSYIPREIDGLQMYWDRLLVPDCRLAWKFDRAATTPGYVPVTSPE